MQEEDKTKTYTAAEMCAFAEWVDDSEYACLKHQKKGFIWVNIYNKQELSTMELLYVFNKKGGL